MDSLWKQDPAGTDFPRLGGSAKTGVLIIGGGMAGILCAYMLHQAGADYMLVESGSVCDGNTANTTAKLTVQHGLIYDRLIRQFGVEKAKLYLDVNQMALEKYRELCRDIDCDFEEQDSFVYSLDNREKLENEITALQRLGCTAELESSLPLPFAVSGAVRVNNQAQFHPLKFVSAIADGLNNYQHTTVRELIGRTAVTDRGTITADKIIVATHFPFINKHGSYFLKMYQHRSYVIALDNVPKIRGMYVDEKQKGLSFRGYKNLLLLGGGGHRTGKKGGSWPELREFARANYPGAAEKYHWAAQDCVTLDGAPYIGPYSAGTENLYVATGFNKWGMTSSMVAAMILTDMVTGKKSPYESVFSPSRTILRPQLAANAFEAAVNLLTPSVHRCPHLGCALKWNPNEHTWDCPCHGSRFARDGSLIDNPATGDLPKGG